MIQRIQSIFFLLAGICFGGEFAVPFATTNTTSQGLFGDAMYNVQDHIVLQVLAGLGALLCLGAIFMYGNRKNQIKTGYLITTVAILLPLIAILIYSGQIETVQNVEVNDSAGLYLPLGMILFAILGVNFTKKDEKLVQSMDRLR